jgi:hypothetical protein
VLRPPLPDRDRIAGMANTQNQPTGQRTVPTAAGSRAGIWAAGIYLVAVAAVTVWAAYSIWNEPEANFAGVGPFLITAPWSLLPLNVIYIDADATLSPVLLIALPAIGALINAVIIGAAAQKIVHAVNRHRDFTSQTSA